MNKVEEMYFLRVFRDESMLRDALARLNITELRNANYLIHSEMDKRPAHARLFIQCKMTRFGSRVWSTLEKMQECDVNGTKVSELSKYSIGDFRRVNGFGPSAEVALNEILTKFELTLEE